MRLRMLLWVLCCIFDAYAKGDRYQVDISFEDRSYFKVYRNPYIKAIRRELTKYLQETSWRDSLRDLNVPFADLIIQDTSCVHYYSDSFSVVHIWPGHFGGINGLIIFKHKPDRIFRIWVYKIDENEYQLRQIEPQSDFTREEIAEIINKFGKRLFAKSL